MDALHNLLREASNSRNDASASTSTTGASSVGSSSALGTLGQTLASHSMTMPQGSGSMAMSLGLNLPMPTMGGLPGANSLAPMPRMNSLLGNNSPMFPSLANTIPGLTIPSSSTTPPTVGSNASTPSSTTTSSSKPSAPAATKSAASKKRKAPPSSTADPDSAEEKQPEEYLDPKAKRRAQIAKAARKHRQRQKDELIALRAKVKDLKEQIEVLQSSEPSEHNTELGWKQEAEQHAEIRARVDQENEFLRKTLMEQMKFIQRLQDYFTKQPLLNMPSLDLILNSSGSAAPAPGALSTALSTTLTSTPSTTLQLPSSSFQDQLRRLANDAMSGAEKALADCDNAFRTPKNPTMLYFGLEVQYEMSKTEMGIFFRHHIYNCDASTVMDDLWECVGKSSFEKKFPFMDAVELLEELDTVTKYIRRVVSLSMGNDSAQQSGTMKEESLVINQKRENPDGSFYFISRSVKNDPSRPKPVECIRRDQSTTVSLRNFSDGNGSGCLLLWSVKVFVDTEPDERSKPANIPDIILKNLFEITPLYVKGIVERARGVVVSAN